jgi:hypothetical protein
MNEHMGFFLAVLGVGAILVTSHQVPYIVSDNEIDALKCQAFFLLIASIFLALCAYWAGTTHIGTGFMFSAFTVFAYIANVMSWLERARVRPEDLEQFLIEREKHRKWLASQGM